MEGQVVLALSSVMALIYSYALLILHVFALQSTCEVTSAELPLPSTLWPFSFGLYPIKKFIIFTFFFF